MLSCYKRVSFLHRSDKRDLHCSFYRDLGDGGNGEDKEEKEEKK